MQVSFKPNVKYNQNFTALDIKKITSSAHDAEVFETRFSMGYVEKTKENADDLLRAINAAKNMGEKFAAQILEGVAKDWGLIK